MFLLVSSVLRLNILVFFTFLILGSLLQGKSDAEKNLLNVTISGTLTSDQMEMPTFYETS